MSLVNRFYIDTARSRADVQETLLKLPHFVYEADFEHLKSLRAPGLFINIYNLDFERGVTRQAGIEARIGVSFNRSGVNAADTWEESTVRAVLALLHACSGDALLMYCSDTPVLLRKDGKLILDKRTDLWELVGNDLLGLVDLPYEFGVIPVS